jgi:hypothetical protein
MPTREHLDYLGVVSEPNIKQSPELDDIVTLMEWSSESMVWPHTLVVPEIVI